MDKSWDLTFYKSPHQNNPPVKDFISKLNIMARAKVASGLNLLAEYGLKVGPPHFKKLTGTQFWELRILGKDSIRIIYVAVIDKKFLILHAFIKKKQRTDKKQIQTAESRFNEYKARIKNL